MSHHQLTELVQTDDWAKEKHVPVIECPDQLAAGDWNEVRVTVGKEVEHPNTTAHHIRWIELYFLPEDAKLVVQVARFEFDAHGESTQGADEGPVYTHSCGAAAFKTDKPGRLYALSYCNIHGLWQSSKEVALG